MDRGKRPGLTPAAAGPWREDVDFAGGARA